MWVTWPERALAARALNEVKERMRQIRKIGTRIRKKCICGANTIAQNPAAGIHFRLLYRTCLREQVLASREGPIAFNRFFSVKKFLCGAQK